jgi:hypothetical protein
MSNIRDMITRYRWPSVKSGYKKLLITVKRFVLRYLSNRRLLGM